MDYEKAWNQLRDNATSDLSAYEKDENYLNANICRMIIGAMDKIESDNSTDITQVG